MKICDLEKCTSCGVCSTLCPKNAIKLVYNKSGEFLPHIDYDKCIGCNLCKRVCQVNEKVQLKDIQKCFAAWRKNNKKRERSASGGIGTAFAEKIIENDGIVYSAMLDDNEEVSICRITNSTDLNKIQGSKYVYSYVKNTYLEVKQDLESGKQILYIGLPCQIAGLYNSLKGGEYPNLITVDIICHGSVSQLLWKEHVEYLQKKASFSYDNFSFRSNKWDENYHLCFHENGKTVLNLSSWEDEYFTGFLNGSILRDSCYHCEYKQKKRVGDISIGDFIGLNKTELQTADNGNTSVILVNSQKGESFVLSNREEIELVEREINEAVDNGPSLNGNINKYRNKRLFNIFNSIIGFHRANIIVNLWLKILNKLRKIFRRV